MCGVVGRFAWSAAALGEDALLPLVDLLHHRGPDGGGYWNEGPFFLGHRRLSILDLSEAGAQPMASPDGRFVLTYNGEIYNFVELRAELEALGYAFTSRSDTEIVLHAYDAWGERMVERLTGMFGFAIADRRERTVFLARDRFGEKPLFYCERPGEVVFASELSPLAAHLGERSVDLEGLAGYLCLNYVPLDRTLLAGVRRVKPGTTRTYDAEGRVKERVYHRPGGTPEPDADRMDLEEILIELRKRLDDAVRIALRSDVPLALFLSGGIDSSLVAESAVRQGTLDAAYCIDVREASFSEWDNASWVASRLGLSLERVPLEESAIDDFFSIVSHADDPLADSSAVAVWTLARATAKRFKVAVSGDGGDELFGGYLTYQATAVHRATTSRLGARLRGSLSRLAPRLRVHEGKVTASYKLLRYLRAVDLPPSQAHFTWNGAWLPSEAARFFANTGARERARHALSRVAEAHGLPARPTLGELQRADAAEYLPNDILAKVDRMTMAHSLESRAPLLDHRFASLAFAATPRFEPRLAAHPKRLLRALADRTFGPRVSRAKKQGFSIPIHAWLRGRGRPIVDELLSESSLRDLPFLDAAEVLAAKERLLTAGEPLGFEIWGLSVLVAWHRARVLGSARRVGDRAHPLVQVRVA
jgi:asparagine synthase (glutamine-hydrolysing)